MAGDVSQSGGDRGDLRPAVRWRTRRVKSRHRCHLNPLSRKLPSTIGVSPYWRDLAVVDSWRDPSVDPQGWTWLAGPTRSMMSVGQTVALSFHGIAMAKLIGIFGSLRRGSFNTALLRAATELVPSGTELVTETLHGIPLYDGDVETAGGLPRSV
jgi:hypothetical protein